jgi:glycosyltransferase involved in cell wall biosynthesis
MTKFARKITVITVVYNDRVNIAKTIESIISQDYLNFEYIVVDGASTDGTLEIINCYKSSIDEIISTRDNGVYDAMNKAIKLANGEFLIFMNSGDLFFSSSTLSILAENITEDKLQIIGGDWIRHSLRSDKCVKLNFDKGIFNHQSILYSKVIHEVYGLYLNIKGFTAADYLFFSSLYFSSNDIRWKSIDDPIAVIDITGLSAGVQTLSQKYAVDYIFGRSGRIDLILIIAAHPFYHFIKKVINKFFDLVRDIK